jgi:hypothetical protein
MILAIIINLKAGAGETSAGTQLTEHLNGGVFIIDAWGSAS